MLDEVISSSRMLTSNVRDRIDRFAGDHFAKKRHLDNVMSYVVCVSSCLVSSVFFIALHVLCAFR